MKSIISPHYDKQCLKIAKVQPWMGNLFVEDVTTVAVIINTPS